MSEPHAVRPAASEIDVITPNDPLTRIRHVVRLGVVVAILGGLTIATVLWRHPLWEMLTDREVFRQVIEGFGPYAPLAFIAAQVVQVVIFFVPGEITQVAGGYLFGTWLGLLYTYVGITAGSLIAFYLGRLFEHAATDLLVDRETVRRFDRLVYGKSGFWPPFILFLLPGFPKDLLCYIAGLTRMHVGLFLIISTVGRFPGVLLSSLVGDGMAEGDWSAVALSGGVALSLTLVAYLLRRPIERLRAHYLVSEEERRLLGGPRSADGLSLSGHRQRTARTSGSGGPEQWRE